MDKKFIVTQSEESAELLIQMGFQLVNKLGMQYFFYNEPQKKIAFTNIKDIVYTNKYFV